MKSKQIFITLCSFILLVSCATGRESSSIQVLKYKQVGTSDRENIYPSVEKCTNFYTNNRYSVLEVSCNTDNDGIYLFSEGNSTKYQWYDQDFNLWATSESCNTIDDCYYEIKVDDKGVIQGFIYTFFINLSEGYYKVKVQNNALEVVEKKIFDHPS